MDWWMDCESREDENTRGNVRVEDWEGRCIGLNWVENWAIKEDLLMSSI